MELMGGYLMRFDKLSELIPDFIVTAEIVVEINRTGISKLGQDLCFQVLQAIPVQR